MTNGGVKMGGAAKTFRSFNRFVMAQAFVVLIAFAAGTASAAGPSWMPGFPLRAGENILLMWMPFPGASSYNIYKAAKPGGPYQKVGSTPAPNYMDPNVPATTSAYYVVKAVTGGKEGDASTEVAMKGVEPLKAPKFTGHLVTAAGKISIRWDTVPNAAFYNLFRSESEKGAMNLLSSVQDTSYTDGAVKTGKTYFYAVTAVSATNTESPKSATYKDSLEQTKETTRKVLPMVKRNVKFAKSFYGNEKSEFGGPKKVDFDAQGNIYVLDGKNSLQKLDPEGAFQKYVATKENGELYTDVMTGFFLDRAKGDLYVAYSQPPIVRKFDANGKLALQFAVGTPDPKDTPATDFPPTPSDIAVGKDGTIWITENSYFQLLGYDASGKEIKRLGKPRGNKGRSNQVDLVSPAYMTIGVKSGNIYVAEPLAARTSVWKPTGERVGVIGAQGAEPGELIAPNGIFASDDGEIMIVDAANLKVEVFNEGDASYKCTFFVPDAPAGKQTQIGAPKTIAVFKGRLWVAEASQDKVSLFSILK